MRQIVEDNLDVDPQDVIPEGNGADFTFDHLPRYPSRDDRILMIQDLVIAFGTFFLHHPDDSCDTRPGALLIDPDGMRCRGRAPREGNEMRSP